MTNDQKRANIEAEVARGKSALRSAEALYALGEWADAISRAYYAAFHYARALLLTGGAESKTHAGVERILQRDFVHAGTVKPEVAALLAKLHAMRANADYTAEYVFTQSIAMEQLEAARTFASAVHTLLVTDAWLRG